MNASTASPVPRTSIPGAASPGDNSGRPLWSVMIPTYEPDERYLHETLTSVLAQALPPAEMQIEVVDDGSGSDVAAMVAKTGCGRVSFRRNAERQGLFGNWNACIDVARGRYVHILHQDDVVLDGFYATLGQVLDAHPEAGAAFCRHIYIDEKGLWILLSDIEQREAGVLSDWRRRFAAGISIQCPAMVVRRSAYEKLGGFDTRFDYGGDVEMWLRIAGQMPVCFEPRVLACWRMHNKSASTGLIAQGHALRDGFRTLALVLQYFPECHKEATVFKAKLLGDARHRIGQLARNGSASDAVRQVALLWSLDRWSWRTLKVVVRLAAIIAWTRVALRNTRFRG